MRLTLGATGRPRRGSVDGGEKPPSQSAVSHLDSALTNDAGLDYFPCLLTCITFASFYWEPFPAGLSHYRDAPRPPNRPDRRGKARDVFGTPAAYRSAGRGCVRAQDRLAKAVDRTQARDRSEAHRTGRRQRRARFQLGVQVVPIGRRRCHTGDGGEGPVGDGGPGDDPSARQAAGKRCLRRGAGVRGHVAQELRGDGAERQAAQS